MSTAAHRRVNAHLEKLPHRPSVWAGAIFKAADATKLHWSYALAMVEGESDFRNIFGHDAGGMYPGRRVTRFKVWRMIRAVERGHVSNGVGVTQLTSIGFIKEARALGGAHKPHHQMIVGFHLLRGLIMAHGPVNGFAAYNGGEGGMHLPGPQQYGHAMVARADRWHRIIEG